MQSNTFQNSRIPLLESLLNPVGISRNRKQHIYWFAPYNLSCPSTRYRGKYPLEYLHKEFGTSYDFIIPDNSWKGIINFFRVWVKILLIRKSNSLIAIQKVCTNRLYANALKLLVLLQRKNTLYDLDDAEYFRHDPCTLNFFIKNCQFVQVGSEALREYCLKLNPNVSLATSPVVTHNHRKKKRGPKPVIGWVGDFGNGKKATQCFSHKTSMFQLLFPSIIQIKYPLKLSLIGIKNPADIPEIEAYFANYPNIELEIPTDLNWENDLWLYDKIREFDIGVSPMVSHPFNRAKSAFKAKQYLSCGVPVIGSDIGENNRFIHHGFNGFLCDEFNGFGQMIDKIVEMSDETYSKFVINSIASTPSFSIQKYCEILLRKGREFA